MEKVTIIGVGGVGSWIVDFLSRATKQMDVVIRIVDNDTVETKNVLYADYEMGDNGKSKVLALAMRCARVGRIVKVSDSKIENPGQLDPFISGIVVVATDDFLTRRFVHDYCERWVDVRAEGKLYQIFTHESKITKDFTSTVDTERGSCQVDPIKRIDMAHVMCAAQATQIVLSMLRNEKFPAQVLDEVK